MLFKLVFENADSSVRCLWAFLTTSHRSDSVRTRNISANPDSLSSVFDVLSHLISQKVYSFFSHLVNTESWSHRGCSVHRYIFYFSSPNELQQCQAFVLAIRKLFRLDHSNGQLVNEKVNKRHQCKHKKKTNRHDELVCAIDNKLWIYETLW